MKNFFNLRIFWTCSTQEAGDGYYYHFWSNLLLNKTIQVFAGYSRHVLISKDSSFSTVQARLKE